MNAPLAIAAGRLRIEFCRDRDRFGHTISLVADDRTVQLLSSAEGTVDDIWPASPPLQELHVEERPGGRRVALLVGMAGTSHWSASIEADPEHEWIEFDVACRLRAAAGALGSHYRIASGVKAAEVAGGIKLALGGGGVQPAPAEQGIRLVLDAVECSGAGGVRLAADQLEIVAQAAPSTHARTIRWKYAVFCSGEPAGRRSIGP